MTARILPFPGAPQPKSSPRLWVMEDEFSVKVRSVDDRRFWIRVERGQGDSVVVSDFVQGDVPENSLAQGLSLALQALRAQHRKQILFRDIVPGGSDSPRFASRLEQVTECARHAARAVAADSGRKVAAFRVEPRGGKMDAVATLA